MTPPLWLFYKKPYHNDKKKSILTSHQEPNFHRGEMSQA